MMISLPNGLSSNGVIRVVSVFAGVMIMIGTGSLYSISAWNQQMKALLKCSQEGISTISSCALIGSYLSIFPGIILDGIGAQNSVCLAGIGLTGVYLLLFTMLKYYLSYTTPLIIGIGLLIVGQLSCFATVAAVIANEGIYGPDNRGKVMSTLMASYTIGGAAFAIIYHTIFNNDVSGYFAFLGCFLGLTCLLAWFSFTSETRNINKTKEIPTAWVETIEDKDVDITGWNLLQEEQFWLLFLPVFVAVGGGLFIMSNIYFIIDSLQGPVEQVPTMVAVFALGNTISRIITGTASDMYLSKYPRANFAALSILLTAITQISFFIVQKQWLIIPVALSGVAEGAMFAMFPVILRESFGAKHYGTNFGLMSLANCLACPFVYNPIASWFYRHYATKSALFGAIDKCVGYYCFGPVMLLILCLCIAAFYCCIRLAKIQTLARYHAIPTNIK